MPKGTVIHGGSKIRNNSSSSRKYSSSSSSSITVWTIWLLLSSSSSSTSLAAAAARRGAPMIVSAFVHNTSRRSISIIRKSSSILSRSSSSSIHINMSSGAEDQAAATKTATTASTPTPSTTPTLWPTLKPLALQHAILPLSETAHKGSSGRVAILGGSEQYTGAPYYAAMAALTTGADLAYVLTAHEAAGPIKGYSPELMVTPVYHAGDMERAWERRKQEQQAKDPTATTSDDDDECQQLVNDMVQKVTQQLQRVHCLIIGPGLGRSPLVFQAVAAILQSAKEQGLAIVLDADALFMLSSSAEYRHLLQGYEQAVLTPNVVEYKRLFQYSSDDDNDNDESSSPFENVVIVQKGRHDWIQVNDQVRYVCAETGGLKRSGGIGDVLAGTIGTLVAWKTILEKQQQQQQSGETKDATTNTNRNNKPNLPLSCWTACCFVKRATARAFALKKRAMTAPDILDQLGVVVDEMTTNEQEEEAEPREEDSGR